MFGRPRCREWTPLATQQLRLRSLIQIVGYNIRPPEQCMSACSFYLTLHHTTMSAPFYTSERISSPHPKWKEIDSEITQRMSSTNVVIRIWCHSINEDTNKHNDTVIQTWGVYFSGLRYIGANLALNFTSDCFKSNTLVFQMLGGYFCSYKSLKLDIIPPENETVPGSLSSDSSGRTNLSKITLEAKFLQHQKVKESRSVSPNKFSKKFEREYSKSHSPVERGLKNYPVMKTSNSMNMNQTRRREESVERKQDPNYIYEHEPESMEVACDINCDIVKTTSREELFDSKIDLSETAESYDLRNESDRVPKYRYLALNFLKSEIRPSYNASKLQKLHLLQYSIKKRQEAVQEIKEKIYKKSAMSYDWSQSEECDDKLKFKSKSQRNLFSPEEESEKKSTSQSDLSKNGRVKEERPVSNGPRLTLKLNDLLSFKTKPSPFQRSEHIRLTKQLEILRFKRIILADERDSKLANIRRLKEIHAKLLEENQDVGLELLQDYHALSRRSEILKETRQSCGALRELAARSHAQLVTQRNLLLLQLHQIFYIHQKDETTWTICDVPLPICSDSAPPPGLAGAVAAGLAGQAATLAAAVTSQPLRYRITLLGSASKILDTRVNDLPEPNIPLYPRGGDASLFSYALFLLNKCIAQLMWGRGLPVHDIRPTLHNLQRLLTTSSSLTDSSKLFGAYRWFTDSQCPRTQSLRSLVASERGKHNRQFNRFKDAVDGQSPAIAMNLRRHRHSRSVGSYQDDQDLPALDASTASIMGSEPNIYDTKLAQSNCEGHTLKTHNSDSEISRISLDHTMEETGTKVVFTLGDSDTLETEKLVRISSNNDDEIACSTCLNDNVSRICSEITDFCTKDQEAIDIAKHMEDLNLAGEMTGIDIAQHMARASEIENADLCINCESNKDGMCDLACANDVMDVIVIPSAEAILDTGQREMPIDTDRECE